MALKCDWLTDQREDFSRCMVHLTRDDRGEPEGMTARENFDNILLQRRIAAFRPHCLHCKKVPARFRQLFDVCCFTETPLDQIQHLTGRIAGRQVELEPYGFVFSREFLLRNGAQQVIHVNSYGGGELRASYDAVFDTALVRKFKNKSWRILPFVSAMHDNYDFSWEREWRIRGELGFRSSDLQCVTLPDDEDDELLESLARKGIAYICPGWTYEQIALEIAAQQRRTRKLLKPSPLVRKKASPKAVRRWA